MERKMKDSGIEWIGEIPEGWEVAPVRSCFDEVRTKNTDGQEQNALQFKSGNIISKTNFNANTDDYVADTITNYTVVLPDTVMINGLNLNYCPDGQEQAPNRMQLPAHREDKTGSPYQPAKAQQSCAAAKS